MTLIGIRFTSLSTKKKGFRQMPGDATPSMLHWSTKQGLLPGHSGFNQDEDALNFLISWHVESSSKKNNECGVMRMYWSFGEWMTRLYPMDAIHLWPQYF